MSDIQLFLRRSPFFEGLEDRHLTEISTLLVRRNYPKEANIFNEEDYGQELYFIQSGAVQIYRNSGGRDIIFSILSDGEFFGEMAVLQSERFRSASAKTLEESILYILKKSDFIALLEKSPEISLKLLETAMERLREANDLVTDLTILDARSRLARLLLRLGEQHGWHTESGLLINLKLTHQQLADMIGAVRETVTKLLIDLQHDELIYIDKRKIIIRDSERLSEMVGQL